MDGEWIEARQHTLTNPNAADAFLLLGLWAIAAA